MTTDCKGVSWCPLPDHYLTVNFINVFLSTPLISSLKYSIRILLSLLTVPVFQLGITIHDWSSTTPCIEYSTDKIFHNSLQYYILVRITCITLKSENRFTCTHFRIFFQKPARVHFLLAHPVKLIYLTSFTDRNDNSTKATNSIISGYTPSAKLMPPFYHGLGAGARSSQRPATNIKHALCWYYD